MICRYLAKPFSYLPYDAAPDDRDQWLKDNLNVLGFDHCYYLQIASPWAKVEVEPSGEWLTRLWATGKVNDVIILSSDKQNFLDIQTNEYKPSAILERVSNLSVDDFVE